MSKSLPKILTIIFLLVFIIQLSCLIVLLALPQTSQAISFEPQVQGLDYKFNASDTSTGNIANYIKAIYKYAIGIVGILAAIVLMFGGVLWIVAGGNATQISEAKAWIGASLTGLVLALTSYLILYTVNPALVDLKTTGITKVGEYTNGSCTTIEEQVCTDNVTEENCLKTYAVFEKGGTCPKACCLWDEYASGGLWRNCLVQKTLTKRFCDGMNKSTYIPKASNVECQRYKPNDPVFSGRYTGCIRK